MYGVVSRIEVFFIIDIWVLILILIIDLVTKFILLKLVVIILDNVLFFLLPI